jgi:hypothetical protein
MSAEDKVTLAPSAAAQAVLDRLESDGHFREQAAAFQSAAALAIALDLDTTKITAGGGSKTKWSSAAFGDALAFVEWYLDTDQPVRTLERLGEAGLLHIASRLDSGYRITEIFSVH